MAPRKKKTTEEKTTPKKKFEYQLLAGKATKLQDLENMNSLGQEGWELVQTLKDKSDRTFIFKREL